MDAHKFLLRQMAKELEIVIRNTDGDPYVKREELGQGRLGHLLGLVIDLLTEEEEGA